MHSIFYSTWSSQLRLIGVYFQSVYFVILSKTKQVVFPFQKVRLEYTLHRVYHFFEQWFPSSANSKSMLWSFAELAIEIKPGKRGPGTFCFRMGGYSFLCHLFLNTLLRVSQFFSDNDNRFLIAVSLFLFGRKYVKKQSLQACEHSGMYAIFNYL